MGGRKSYFVDDVVGKRPKDKRKRKNYYSGKKKRHTVKTQYMVNKEGTILHKSNQHKKGKNHDYAVYKDEYPLTSPQVKNLRSKMFFNEIPKNIMSFLRMYHVYGRTKKYLFLPSKTLQDPYGQESLFMLKIGPWESN